MTPRPASRPHETPGPAIRPRPGGLRLRPALLRQGMRQFGRYALDPGLPWEVQRQRFRQVTGASLVPRGTAVTTTVLSGVPAEVVTAGREPPAHTVVHFHGGGYCVGSARMMRPWAAYLSGQAACRVVLPEYRLAPEHPCPAALDDARSVITALLAEAGPRSLVVSGDSAGAALALSALLTLRDGGGELPAGCILMSPWLDLAADRWSLPELVRRDVLLSPRWLEACATAYAPRQAWDGPACSPLLAPHGGLPPLLIQAGSDDLLAPDAARFAASASAAGVAVTYTRWPRMWHDFTLLPGLLAAADSAVRQAAWFVAAVTGSSQRTP